MLLSIKFAFNNALIIDIKLEIIIVKLCSTVNAIFFKKAFIVKIFNGLKTL